MSKTRYIVDIDFDEASRLWRANKRRNKLHNAFEYCCGALKPNGEFCKSPPHSWNTSVRKLDPEDDGVKRWGYCTFHQKMKIENTSDSKPEDRSEDRSEDRPSCLSSELTAKLLAGSQL